MEHVTVSHVCECGCLFRCTGTAWTTFPYHRSTCCYKEVIWINFDYSCHCILNLEWGGVISRRVCKLINLSLHIKSFIFDGKYIVYAHLLEQGIVCCYCILLRPPASKTFMCGIWKANQQSPNIFWLGFPTCWSHLSLSVGWRPTEEQRTSCEQYNITTRN